MPLAYTGDTGPSHNVADLAHGADLLLAEASYVNQVPSDSRRYLSARGFRGRNGTVCATAQKIAGAACGGRSARPVRDVRPWPDMPPCGSRGGALARPAPGDTGGRAAEDLGVMERLSPRDLVNLRVEDRGLPMHVAARNPRPGLRPDPALTTGNARLALRPSRALMLALTILDGPHCRPRPSLPGGRDGL